MKPRYLSLIPLLVGSLAMAETLTIDAVQREQVWRGFGTCLTPWEGQMVSLYESSSFQNTYVKDMGMTLMRIELMPEVHPAVTSADDIRYQNFNLDSGGALPHANNSRARVFLNFALAMKALDPEAKVIGTAWSLPSWTKSNNLPWEGGAPLANRYEHVAQWCIEWVKLYRAQGLDLCAISFANEPQFSQFYNSQVINPEPYAAILEVVGRRMRDQGFGDVMLFGPEHMMNDLTRNQEYANEIVDRGEAASYLSAFATHGYIDGVSTDPDLSGAGTLWRLIAKPNGWEYWMTESGSGENTYDTALDLTAAAILANLRANCSLYTLWQVTGAGASEHNLMVMGNHTVKSRAFQHFSKYLRPGMVRLGSESDGDVEAVAFGDPGKGTLALVLLNRMVGSRTVNLRLPYLAGLTKLSHWRTTSASDPLTKQTDVTVSAGAASLTLPKRSFHTLTAEGVDFTSLPQVTVSPLRFEVDGSAHTGTVEVTVANGPYEWLSASNKTWVKITLGGSGTESDTIGLSISKNPSRTNPRTALLTVGPYEVEVVQAPFADQPSFWSAAAKDAATGARPTYLAFAGEPGIGWIYDRSWPFVYHYALGRWLWIHETGASAQNFYAYLFGENTWIWGNNAWGMYYHFADGQWHLFP